MTESPLFLRTCRGEPTERTPIWLMRQAGRYMAEYRAVRAKADFWTLCKTPELACEVTLQPIDAFGLDASIIFSDLLVSLPPLGFPVTFVPGKGPVIDGPVHTADDVGRSISFSVEKELGYVGDAVRMTRAALPKDVPLIGFAGAPFTLASYLIEGGSSKAFMKTKAFLHQHPEAAAQLFDRLTEITIELLTLQAESGAEVLQVFDSWAGCLDPEQYRRWGLGYTERIVSALRKTGCPIIVFPKGCGAYLDIVAECGADVIGLDWATSLPRARELVGPDVVLQGNLDPGYLLGTPDALDEATDRLLADSGNGQGHIFNLGHGIHLSTPPSQVERLVKRVQTRSGQLRN